MQLKNVYTLAELPTIVAETYEATRPNRIFCLSGAMGAGKTTFIAALCAHLGVTEPTSSPTYSLVQQYEAAKNNKKINIFHLDLFRLKSLNEAYDIGITDILDTPNALIFIEWHELVEPLLPDEVVFIHIDIAENNTRILNVKCNFYNTNNVFS